MKHCPITYENITAKQNYSERGLHKLSPQLKNLQPLGLTVAEQRQEAIARAGKMSIQGIQTKLSAQLKIKEECFALVDQNGHYILKTQSEYYAELPENEALTMSLAASIGIEVPTHGLIYAIDNSMVYFIKRFDRSGHQDKLAVEDFAQLLQLNRDTKYNSSMEKISDIITKYCTFPKIEALKFFKLVLFNFLVGNEDMHVKNFSLITRGNITTLSPAYDLLNTTIAQANTKEELALPLHGKKSNLNKRDFLVYFAQERLQLNTQVIQRVLDEIKQALPHFEKLIGKSFLSALAQKKYVRLLAERSERLGIPHAFSADSPSR